MGKVFPNKKKHNANNGKVNWNEETKLLMTFTKGIQEILHAEFSAV